MKEEIPILNQEEIIKMMRAGAIAAELKTLLTQKSQLGITTRELDQFAENFILENGAKPAFKGFQGYPFTLVTCVNEEVVHAMPGSRSLKTGDLLTIDLGGIAEGFYSDTALTFVINEPQKEKRFLEAGQMALNKAISQCIEGKYVGDISHVIQTTVEDAGYSVVRMFTGHGVGRNLHQPPEIPCWGPPHTGPELKEGMGLAVEVMYTKGSSDVKILEDGWTAITTDGSLSAMFEETVIVGRREPQITTRIKG
ncbi:type I methionyl aminopeptidase [Patescibacteria group bacterium]|nr:type I methionyl aminopeptidase [Patescibacteria group bacterium]